MEKENLLNRLLTSGSLSLENGSHSYRLCTKPYVLTSAVMQQVNEIGIAVRCFETGAKKLFDFLQNPKSNFHANLKHIFTQASFGLPSCNTESVPPLIRVEMLIDQKHKLVVTEIDGYNPRGIAYASFLKDLYGIKAGSNSLETFVSGEVKKRDCHTLLWVYARHEHSYVNILTQFAKIMEERHGITVQLWPATKTMIHSTLADKTAVMFVPLCSAEVYTRKMMVEMYERYPQNFLYPLTPWMGNKGLLGIASNATGHADIESLYLLIPELSAIQKYSAPTTLVGKYFKQVEEWSHERDTVLRLNPSIGHHGVWFSQQEDFLRRLRCLSIQKTPNAILQEQVMQKSFSFHYYNGSENVQETQAYVRLIAYIAPDGSVQDVSMSAKEIYTPSSEKDSILLPCVCEKV